MLEVARIEKLSMFLTSLLESLLTLMLSLIGFRDCNCHQAHKHKHPCLVYSRGDSSIVRSLSLHVSNQSVHISL